MAATKEPLAQTVVINETLYLQGINLYFSQKPTALEDPGDSEIIGVELRGANAQGPTDTVLQGGRAYARLKPSQVNISADGTVATYFEFAEPIFIEGTAQTPRSFSVVVRTDSSKYRMFVATVGDNLLGTTTVLDQQPYALGAMYRTENTGLWTPEISTDLKFDFKGVDFQSLESTVEFSPISVAKITSFYLHSKTNVSVKGVTSINWFYQVNGDGVWHGFQPRNYTDLDKLASSIKLKAVITGSRTISPLILRDGLELELLSKQRNGDYVTRTISMVDPFRYVTMYVKQDVPQGTFIKWYVNADNENVAGELTWHEVVATGETVLTLPGENLKEHQRTYDFGSGAAHTDLRVKMVVGVVEGDGGDPDERLVKKPVVKDLIAIANG